MDQEQRKLAEELLASSSTKGSFGKGLFLGKFLESQIFPFPDISEEEKLRTEDLLKRVAAFADAHIDGAAIDREANIPDSVIQGLAELGVLGMTIPKDYGGLGMSQYAYCRVTELITRRCAATALFINAHQSVGLKALLLFGTEEQKKKWLQPLATGKCLAAFSLTEPEAGSDANGIRTRATYDPEKKVWRINGRKQWTTNGAIAQMLTVMAKTEIDTSQGKQDKVTAFIVTPSMPGFKVLDASLEKVGMRGSKTANLAFEEMEVPEENILGPLGGGLKVCLTVLDFGRTTFGAMCTGAAKYLVERAVAHAKSRHQFNRPLASFGLVKEKIAKMNALAYAMEATTYLTAGFIDNHAEDFMLESAMLKVFASDSLWVILYETMQIFGGRSFFTDQPFERMMRDARLNMIGEGSNEVMRAFIGAVGVREAGMQLKSTLESALHPISQFPLLRKSASSWISRLTVPRVTVKSSEIKPEAVALGRRIRSFGFATAKLLIKYREEIIEKQLQLDRLATIAMAIYSAAASLSKLDREIHKSPEDIATVKFYCRLAFRTIDHALEGIMNNDDQQLEKLSDQITGL